MITLENVSVSETARYMGVKGEPDENVIRLIEKADSAARKAVAPKYVYRVSGVEILSDGVKLSDCGIFLSGDDIKKHFERCGKAVVFAATLSAEADKLIRRAEVTDMAEALAMDCVCSSLIEQFCDKAEEEIFREVKAAYRTWRFSPGYGDLPISVQDELVRALNAQRRIGLTVTPENILIPSKSVTAVIGISEVPVHERSGKCEFCNMRGMCAFSAQFKEE